MRHAVTTAALSAALILTAACSGAEEPSAPPTPEDALTSETATSTPDDVEETSAAPSPDDSTETAVADGPPELPAEATEQTEAGAEAFARHYFDLINYTGLRPQKGLLERLSSSSCKSCVNFEDNVQYLVENDLTASREPLAIESVRPIDLGDSAAVFVRLSQDEYQNIDTDGDVVDEYDAVETVEFNIDLRWDDDRWKIDSIATSEG